MTDVRILRLRRVRAELAGNRTVLLNAASMVSTTLVTALLGFLFWLIAAREFTQSAVGLASAAVSAMMLLGSVSTIGLGTLLMGDLPRRRSGHRGLINAAVLVSGGVGLVLGLLFAVVASSLSAEFGPLAQTPLAALAFAAGVSLTGITWVLDQALIGLMRGRLQFARNVVFSVGKLLLLAAAGFAIGGGDGVWIYGAWTVGIAMSIVALLRFYANRGDDPLKPAWRALFAMRRSAASHHLYNLAIRAPDLVLPLVVVAQLSAGANANFYIAWTMAGFLFAVPLSLSLVLYAAGSGDPTRLAHRYRMSAGLSLALGVVGNVVLLAAASPILSLFGASYAEGATSVVHILALGVFPEIVKTHYLSIRRFENRIGRAMPIVVAGAAMEIAGVAIGGTSHSLQWVAAGWLIAACIEAAMMAADLLWSTRLGSSAGSPLRRGRDLRRPSEIV